MREPNPHPKFSFILPAYKARYLSEAIESILSQTEKDFELVVVDDASPENLKAIVDSFSDRRISYHRNENNIGGHDLVAQWNHCITFAVGECLILASDDDTYHQSYLEKMSELISRYPSCDIYRCMRQISYTATGVTEKEATLPEFISGKELFRNMIFREAGTGLQHYIFRRDTLMANGGFVNFPYAWFTDDATVVLMARNGIAIHPEILFTARISDISITGRRNSPSEFTGKCKALSRWENFILTNSAQEDLRQDETTLDYFRNQFKPLHCYHLMLQSGIKTLIGTAPYILFRLPIPVRLRLLYFIKSLIKCSFQKQ